MMENPFLSCRLPDGTDRASSHNPTHRVHPVLPLRAAGGSDRSYHTENKMAVSTAVVLLALKNIGIVVLAVKIAVHLHKVIEVAQQVAFGIAAD